MAPAVDIVTLENFEEKMPPWDQAQENHLYALVDMGSNGIRFSISDLSPPTTRLLKCIYRERAGISLFDALNASLPPSSCPSSPSSTPLTFPPETVALVASTISRFRSIALDSYGVPPAQFTVFATEAMRRAVNAATMLDAIAAAAPGVHVHVLAPPVETLFGAVGARAAFKDVRGLLLDLGGGSVQMTYMDTSVSEPGLHSPPTYEIAAAQAGESLPFGAARLIRVLDSADGQARASATDGLRSGMREAFEKLRGRFPSLAATVEATKKGSAGSDGIDVYLCGGGFRGYGSMLMHNDAISPYPISSVGAYTVSGAAFCATQEMLRVNAEFPGRVFGMSRRRRQQFPAIVAVVEALVAAVPRIRSATFCGGGNREGALMMKLPRHVREVNPLILLDRPFSASDNDEAILKSVTDTIRSALPPANAGAGVTATVFSLDLGAVFARQVWLRAGEPAEANASAALRDAVTRNPSCPGLTHLARAVLGLTLCARWGGGLGPIDWELERSLRALLHAADPKAEFWAQYVGAVAAALAVVVPAWPRDATAAGRLAKTIRFESRVESGHKKDRVVLRISIAPQVARGITLADIEDLFKDVGRKEKNEDTKLLVTVHEMVS